MARKTAYDPATRLQYLAQERDHAVNRFNVRRNLEWKLALALWAGLGLAANAIADLKPLSCGIRWGISITAGLIVLLHLYWVGTYVVRSAKLDRLAALDYAELIASELNIPGPNKKPADYNAFAAHFWPVMITLLIAALILLTVWG